MPRIPDEILECAVYLYSSVEDALEGRPGPSGFLVGAHSAVFSDAVHPFVATASHAVRESGCRVVRLNTPDGGTDAIEIGEEDWIHHPDGDDVAIAFLPLDEEKYVERIVSERLFLTKGTIAEFKIGPGDDAYMIGRFVGHDGKLRNLPTVRFGNVAMMPLEPIWHRSRGIAQESFLVEVRSLPGYSGSAVFIHIPPLAPRPGEALKTQGFGPWLLGVDWCHLHSKEPVRDPADEGRPIPERWYVESNSGMMGVVPAWKIADLLSGERAMAIRNQEDEKDREKVEKSNVTLDAPFTKDDFEEALRKASRRRGGEQSEKEKS